MEKVVKRLKGNLAGRESELEEKERRYEEACKVCPNPILILSPILILIRSFIFCLNSSFRSTTCVELDLGLGLRLGLGLGSPSA